MTGRLVQTVFDLQYNAEFKTETGVGGTCICHMALGKAVQNGKVVSTK